ISLALDLDRAKQMRETSRSNDHLSDHLVAPEHMQLSSSHIGGGYEQLKLFEGPHRIKIDKTSNQILQRIDVERVEVIWRQVARQRLHPQADGGVLDRPKRKQTIDGAPLHLWQIAAEARRTPEFTQALARLLRPAARKPVRQHNGIDRAGGCARNSFDREPAVVQQMVENAPRKCAECAAPLQCEVDALGGFRFFRLITAKRTHEKVNH